MPHGFCSFLQTFLGILIEKKRRGLQMSLPAKVKFPRQPDVENHGRRSWAFVFTVSRT